MLLLSTSLGRRSVAKAFLWVKDLERVKPGKGKSPEFSEDASFLCRRYQGANDSTTVDFSATSTEGNYGTNASRFPRQNAFCLLAMSQQESRNRKASKVDTCQSSSTICHRSIMDPHPSDCRSPKQKSTTTELARNAHKGTASTSCRHMTCH